MQLSEKKIIKQIGDNIPQLRLERHLSQFQLQVDANVVKNQIGRIERGEHIPNIITIIKIAKALNVSLSEIIDLKKKII
ncbi:helix-turn-helix domain-containing protein [Pseudotamlana agarivorans]|uniref:helix-turn-helix domain-containing protein n=1 Tax=Pseudotamlana agarivorans TaxID=481183 RepID=UPI00082F5ED2|nr:helix-turn-helix transcriptional regulator [Tamlana agarivorans]